MLLFKDMSDQAVRLAKIGSKKVKDTGRIASLKLNNLTARDEITRLYAKIGERYYKQHGLSPEAGFEKLCDKVTALNIAITQNEADITELKIDGIVDDEVIDPDDVEG